MHSSELHDMLYLPRRGVQEEELQGRRSGAPSETNASIAGCGELFLVLQLQLRYLRGQAVRRSHLRQCGTEEEPRSFEREATRLHLRRLPDGGEDEEVACRRHDTEMNSSRAAELSKRYVQVSRAAEWRSMLRNSPAQRSDHIEFALLYASSGTGGATMT